MNSRDLSRAIRATIRPLLRRHGFSRFMDQSAWRYSHATIHVVNFQSMGSRYATEAEATSHSFAVNLGLYYPSVPRVPNSQPIPMRNYHLMPREYHCHIRTRLRKTLKQSESFETDIWHVDPEGHTLSSVLEHVAQGLVQEALPWFDGWSDRRVAVERLQHSGRLDDGAWASGINPSPERSRVIAYLAWSIDDLQTAETYLKDALVRHQSALAEAHQWEIASWQRTVVRLAADCERLVSGVPPMQ